MYNDTIKVANKIISDKDLTDIFQKMNEEMEFCQKQNQMEIVQNERFERAYQNWTVKDFSGTFKVSVNFYDDTEITFDKYYNFISVFNTRLHEIKSFYLSYHFSYTRRSQGQNDDFISKHINMDVYENKMNIDVSLNSGDKIMNDVYEMIKQKVLSAPEKYDRIVKKKSSICNMISFARGFIPASIILFLLVFVGPIRKVYAITYVGFPIACVIFAYIIGTMFFSGKMERLYESIVPQKKYAGYDSVNNKSVYEDDIDSYIESSEILIGKNVDNLTCRTKIEEMLNKYSGYLKIELLVLLGLSILVVLLGMFIK